MADAQDDNHKKFENVVMAASVSAQESQPFTDCTFHCGSCTSHGYSGVHSLYTV